MRCHVKVAALLALATIGGVTNQPVQAQRTAARAYYQNARPSYQSYQYGGETGSAGPTQVEQLPSGSYEELPSGQYEDGSYIVDDNGGPTMWDDHGPGPGYDYGCYEGYGSAWMPNDGFFSHPGQFFLGGEWLYVRASPSHATAYLEQNFTELETMPFDRFHQLNFKHESAFRFYGGYRLCECGEEIRWTYSQYDSSARAVAPPSTSTVVIHIPMEAVEFPGGSTFITGDVKLKSGDLEYAKTIPLGGPLCCDSGCGECCGDGCGDCCDPCCNPCPTWDITWSGGLRFATADLNRRFVSTDDEDMVVTDGTSKVSFDGGGPRFGLEGRRYFGCDGMFSAYLKGNISLLLGKVNVVNQRTSAEDPGQVISQYFNNRNIIPVTEIETGLTCRVTRHVDLTAGYFFSAWHDLGFRDEFNFQQFTDFGVSYDDANILGFDGLFIRLEAGF